MGWCHGGAPNRNFQNIDGCNIGVIGNGSGTKRGLLVATGAGNFNVSNSYISADPTTTTFVGAGAAASYGGIEVDTPSGIVNVFGSYARGTTGAAGANASAFDMSQTLGILGVDGGCSMNSGNANGLNFTTLPGSSTATYTLSLIGATAAHTTFLPLWGALSTFPAATVTEAAMQLTVPRTTIFKNARASLQTASGGGNSVTFTLRKNGVATAFALDLANITTISNLVNSVTFQPGDLASVQCVATNATATNYNVQFEAV